MCPTEDVKKASGSLRTKKAPKPEAGTGLIGDSSKCRKRHFRLLLTPHQGEGSLTQSVDLRNLGGLRGNLTAVFLNLQEQKDNSHDDRSYREK